MIEAGLSGKKLLPKTSKHMIRIGHEKSHISTIEKRVDIPLDVLRSEVELIDMKSVKPTMHIDFRDVLPFYAKFLDTGPVNDLIFIDEKTHVLLKGHEIYQALNLLSVRKVPVLSQ